MLVSAIAGGDERALSTLYDRHAAVVMGVAFRMVRDEGEAEAILLETFAQLWKEAPRYDPARGSVATWLVMMARSRALDLIRTATRQSRFASMSVDDAPDSALAADDLFSNPSRATEARERRSAIATALCALPASQRVAIELAFFEGLSQTEIATRLAEPLGTVKTRIRLAMTKLRQLLAAHGDEAIV